MEIVTVPHIFQCPTCMQKLRCRADFSVAGLMWGRHSITVVLPAVRVLRTPATPAAVTKAQVRMSSYNVLHTTQNGKLLLNI